MTRLASFLVSLCSVAAMFLGLVVVFVKPSNRVDLLAVAVLLLACAISWLDFKEER